MRDLPTRARRVLRRRRAIGRLADHPPRRSDLRVGVLGPAWLTWLVAPDAVVVDRGSSADLVVVGPGVESATALDAVAAGPWAGARLVGYRNPGVPGTDAALVQPWWSNPLRRVVDPGLPDDLRRLAAAAVDDGVPAPSGHLAAWVAATREVERRRNAALSTDVRGLLLGIEDADRNVVAVCVTKRPALLTRAVDNVVRQSVPTGLVLVTNDDGFDPGAVREQLARVPGAVHLHRDPSTSLGRCLDAALDACGDAIVAKFDDDDHYDAGYVAGQVATMDWSGAAVVGKASYLAYLRAGDRTILRHPGRSHTPVGFVAGGTIVADLARVGGARFPDRNTGEDSGFLAAAEASGAVVVSSACTGYVQWRGGDNTWRIDDDAFAAGAWDLGPGSPDGCFDDAPTA